MNIETILQLIKQSWLDRDSEVIVPELNKLHESALMYLAISSSKMLGERAAEIIFEKEDAA